MLVAKYEIFSGHLDREPLWLETVEGLGAAQERMHKRARKAAGPYFVYSVLTKRVLASIDTSVREPSGQSPDGSTPLAR